MKQTLHIYNYHPPTVNELMKCWRKAGRLKKACVSIMWKSCLEQKLVKASDKRMVSIIITTCKRGRKCDPDAYLKTTLDALVKCKMLVDDSSQWCDFSSTLITTGDKNQTTIILTDIESLPTKFAEGAVSLNRVKPRQKSKKLD